MQVNKTTWFIFVCVVVTIMLSVTGFKNPSSTAQSSQQSIRSLPQLRHEEATRRYPVAEFEEPEPTDPAKKSLRILPVYPVIIALIQGITAVQKGMLASDGPLQIQMMHG